MECEALSAVVMKKYEREFANSSRANGVNKFRNLKFLKICEHQSRFSTAQNTRYPIWKFNSKYYVHSKQKLWKYSNVSTNIKTLLRFQKMISKLIKNHIFWKITKISAKLSSCHISKGELQIVAIFQKTCFLMSFEVIFWKWRNFLRLAETFECFYNCFRA